MSTAEFNYDFNGTYGNIVAEKKHDWMTLRPNGTIAWKADPGTPLQSYVWYIRVTANGDNADYSKINISFVDDSDDATSINSIESQLEGVEGFYQINGIKMETLSKGVNIIRYKNGKTKRVFIK